jgi:hypothetical protein
MHAGGDSQHPVATCCPMLYASPSALRAMSCIEKREHPSPPWSAQVLSVTSRRGRGRRPPSPQHRSRRGRSASRSSKTDPGCHGRCRPTNEGRPSHVLCCWRKRRIERTVHWNAHPSHGVDPKPGSEFADRLLTASFACRERIQRLVVRVLLDSITTSSSSNFLCLVQAGGNPVKSDQSSHGFPKPLVSNHTHAVFAFSSLPHYLVTMCVSTGCGPAMVLSRRADCSAPRSSSAPNKVAAKGCCRVLWPMATDQRPWWAMWSDDLPRVKR